MKEIDEFKEPELYDIFNNDCTEDILWYIKFCEKYKNILEIGVGTGRVAIPLVQNGHEIWGVDNSVDMLKLLRKKIDVLRIKGIHIVEQNMCELELEHRFKIAIVPFCAFNFLHTKEDQREALSALNKCMVLNGVVVFELMTLYTFDILNEATDFNYYRTVNTGLGNIEIYIKNDFEMQSRLLKQNRLIKIYNKNGSVEEKNLVMKNKIISKGEFEELLRVCGFEIQNIYGSFTNEPFNKESKSLIVIAKKVI